MAITRDNTTYSNPYSDITGTNALFNSLLEAHVASGGGDTTTGDPGARQRILDSITNTGDTFKSLFTNLVGRAPTDSELGQFFSRAKDQLVTDRLPSSAQDENNYIQQFINQNFQQAAKDYATQQLQAQQSEATGLANQYRTLGQQALDSTSKYLQDYQAQLEQRLMPQIQASLQAQGLLNTGALNEAIAGTNKDLNAQTQGYLADANLQLQNQANQIQFGGASAPYLYQQSNIMNQVPYLQQQGQAALGFGNQNYFNNQAFQQQLALQNSYFNNLQNSQPSFLRTLGQSFASSFGNKSGQYAAQAPFAAMQAFGPPRMSQFGGGMG